jgi:hypothetical protein
MSLMVSAIDVARVPAVLQYVPEVSHSPKLFRSAGAVDGGMCVPPLAFLEAT